MADAPLTGSTIGITADRRWREQADLFRARGADILHGPTLRTVDLSAAERLEAVTLDLIARPPDYLVVTTGMGMRMWLEAAATWGARPALIDVLRLTRVVARGAKASSAVRRAGLEVWWRAPHETMDEIVGHLRQQSLADARVAVQLFDPGEHPSTQALRDAARELVEIPVYRWVLPDDEGPARLLVEATVAGELAAVTFTSQPAVRQLFRIAEGDGLGERLRSSFNGPVLPACIGPVCAEAAREEGIDGPVWPEPPRLPAMVRQVTERLADQKSD